MKVIVITETHHFAKSVTIPLEIGTAKIEVTDKMYSSYTTVIGVCETEEKARLVLGKRRAEIIQLYGEKALDDENIEDKHSFFTYATRIFEEKG